MLAPSAKRREMFGESHEGELHPTKNPIVRRTLLQMDDSVELFEICFAVWPLPETAMEHENKHSSK